jgi:hypothetical protein
MFFFFAAGCSPFITSYTSAPPSDLAPLATYRWENGTAASAGITAHITGAVEEQLALRGYKKTTGPQADFLVAYRLVIADVPTVYRIDMGPASGVPDELYHRKSYLARQWLTEYMYIGTVRKVGVLTVSVLDPRTKLSLWRGVAEGVFDEHASPLQNMQIQRYAVIELMKNFPLRKR